jgi:hypothetical protein
MNDPIISELLPNLTRYMQLVEKKEYFKHAIEKAQEIVRQLQEYQAKSRAAKLHASYVANQPDRSMAIKRYRTLPLDEKIDCLLGKSDLE